jgi:hypothetical protein
LKRQSLTRSGPQTRLGLAVWSNRARRGGPWHLLRPFYEAASYRRKLIIVLQLANHFQHRGKTTWVSIPNSSARRVATRPEYACGISQSLWTSCCPFCRSKSDENPMKTEILTTRVADGIVVITWAAQGRMCRRGDGRLPHRGLGRIAAFRVRLETKSRGGLPMIGDRFPD